MDQSNLRQELARSLLETSDPYSFVEEAIRLYLEVNPKSTLAGLARKMGFSSRSFVRQLSIGARKPNLSNYKKISEGLGLSSEATSYFGLLIEMQSSPQVSKKTEAQLLDAKSRLARSLEKKVKRIRKVDLVPYEKWPFIYASLGAPNQGKRIEEIVQMSGQKKKVCIEILDCLLRKEIVSLDPKTQKYHAKEELIDLGELGESPVLKSLFKLLSVEATRRADADMGKTHSLFHTSVFSVQSRQLPEIARDLQKLLVAYSTQAEDSTGENLALLSASLIPLHGFS